MITLIMVWSVTWLFHRMPANALRLVLPAVITGSVTGGCLATAHILAGTSDIPKTIAPGLVVAFLFNVFTADQLRRSVQWQHAAAAAEPEGTSGEHKSSFHESTK